LKHESPTALRSGSAFLLSGETAARGSSAVFCMRDTHWSVFRCGSGCFAHRGFLRRYRIFLRGTAAARSAAEKTGGITRGIRFN